MNDIEDIIAHAGVKGMKWGVRKKTRSSENVEVRSLRKKSAKELSDGDIKKAISRMQLEKQYKDLNPKGLSAANKVALSALAIATTVNSVIAFKNTGVGKIIADGIKSKLNG